MLMMISMLQLIMADDDDDLYADDDHCLYAADDLNAHGDLNAAADNG